MAKFESFSSGGAIYDEAAYERGRKRNIIANARKSFYKNYPDYEALEALLERGRVFDQDSYRIVSYKEGFLGSLASAYDSFGKLSEKQVAALRNMIEKSAARRAEWKSAQAAKDAASEWVGEVGKRVELWVKCNHVVELLGQFGLSWIHLCEDKDGNKIVFKGTAKMYGKGEEGSLVAMIKEHGVRDGVKQSIISRPKLIEI